jgi:hypothetical protein
MQRTTKVIQQLTPQPRGCKETTSLFGVKSLCLLAYSLLELMRLLIYSHQGITFYVKTILYSIFSDRSFFTFFFTNSNRT